MNEKLNINQWAEEDRPREKMMLHGASALTNAELLAILIGSGNTEDTAVELMRKVLDGCHNKRAGQMFGRRLVPLQGNRPCKSCDYSRGF